MNFSLISSVLLLALLGSSTAYRSPFAQIAQRYEEQEPIEQQTVYSYGAPAAYRFAYSTPEGLLSRSSSSGSSSRYVQQSAEGASSNYAQLAHEQSSDGSGEVVGRYAYVDPYGKLRVVNYRAGRNGYQPSGDIGPDEEALRQQQELYANDVSYQLQQQAWQQVARGEPVNIGAGIQQAVYSATGASSAAAASSAASSSGNSGSSQTEWQEVNQGSQGSSANYATKNNNQQFAERYTAAGGVKSPAAQLREQSTSVSQSVDSQSTKSVQQASSASAAAAASSAAYTAPQVTQYSTKTVHQPVVQHVQTSYTYQAPAKIVVQPAKIIQSTKSTKSVQQQYSGFQSPAARLVAISNGAASSSASASAAASASASSGAYSSGVKGYSGAIKSAPLRVAPVKVARYVSQPTGGRTVVNFSQGGPVPYGYSYSFK